MVVIAKGYRVVPQSLADGGRGFRHVHLKEHRGAFKAVLSCKEGGDARDVVIAKGKTLFVGNVDDQGGRLCRRTIEDRLRRALSNCGDIVHVQASATAAAADLSTNGSSALSASASRRAISAARFAHVCFKSANGVRQALALEEMSSGALTEDDAADVQRREATPEGENEENDVPDPEGDSRDENGDETCGYAGLIQRHRRNFPPREALQLEVDSAMQRFELEEAAESAERKALLENPEDDDGFVKVTYKRKRGRNTNNSAEAGVAADAGTGAKKKPTGADQLTDFYRFQMREARREQLATLRSKFEQDKARVAKMKEQRKFKPF